MEIKSNCINGQSAFSANGVIIGRLLTRTAEHKFVALQDTPHIRARDEPIYEIRKERLVLSITRHDGSEILSIYAQHE